MTITWSAIKGVPQVPFRRLFEPIRRPVLPGAEIVTAYTDGQVTLRSNRTKLSYREAADLSGFQGVAVGDFVVHGLDILRGSVGVSDSDGAISAVCTVCKTVGPILPEFAAYAIRMQARSGFTKVLARGVREGGADFRRWQTLAELPLPAPPLSVQRQIVAQLDLSLRQIDSLIERQRTLVSILGERARALVAITTTRGISGRTEMVDSELSWVGFVPRHWFKMQTRQVLTLRKTVVGSDWSRTPLLSLTTKGVIPRDMNSGHGKFPASFNDYQLVEADDLIFCLFDMDETPRTVGLVTRSGMVTGAYTRFTVNHRFGDPRFLERYYIAIDDEKRFRPLYTGLRKVVQKSRFLSAGIVLPPLAEQRSIVHYQDERLAVINSLISKAETHISLAGERRDAIIAAAVGGVLRPSSST